MMYAQKAKHWLRRQIARFRMKHSKLFDEAWYREQCGGRISPKEDAVAHYMNGGWHNADPSKQFSNEEYLRANPDVRYSAFAPLEHYLLYGKKENRPASAALSVAPLKIGRYRGHILRRAVSRQWGRICCADMIKRNSSARILVCVQLFYPHSWIEIKQYLKALEPYRCDYVFTCHSEDLFSEVLADIRQTWPGAKIIITANKGFDIGSFHVSLQGIDLKQYDILFKAHTKGTSRPELSMYGQYFRYRDWLLYLFEGILGAKTVHTTIDSLLHRDDCAMVAAENLIVHDPRHKVNMLRDTMQIIDPDMVIPEKYKYVAGTCFACKAAVMEPFQQAELDFEPSRRGFFSVAHCVERTMCFPAQLNGNRICGNAVCSLRRKVRGWQGRKKMYPMRDKLIEDDRFDLDDEFVYRTIEGKKITGYELVPMRLGDIRRRWFDGVVYQLKDCAPYRYLTGDVEAYEEYSRYHIENNLLPMTRERFDELIASMEKNGYNERSVLVVDSDNIIVDGQHRACCLLKMYGEDHVLQVLRIHAGKNK